MLEKSPFNKWLAECDVIHKATFGTLTGGDDRVLFIKKAKKSGLWKRISPQVLVDDIKRRILVLPKDGNT